MSFAPIASPNHNVCEYEKAQALPLDAIAPLGMDEEVDKPFLMHDTMLVSYLPRTNKRGVSMWGVKNKKKKRRLARYYENKRIIKQKLLMCYCYQCKYEVLCEPHDLPDDKEGPIPFVPQEDDEEQLCYCYQCKYEVLCEPHDLPDDKEGPIPFVPQ